MRGSYLDIVRSEIEPVLQDTGSGALSRYRECVAILEKVIDTIRGDLAHDAFADITEEIFFFKEEAPLIWGQYFFYEKLVKIESWRKFEPVAAFRAKLARQLRESEAFPSRHGRICEYYYEGRTDADERLFTRGGSLSGRARLADVVIDRGFTRGAYWLTWMRTHELLRDWLNLELEGPPEGERRKKLEWHASSTQTIELFKGLQLSGCFGEMTFTDVMRWVQETFGVTTDNHSVILQHIRDRKKTEKSFLDTVRQTFGGYIREKQ
jgi:RteC protein